MQTYTCAICGRTFERHPSTVRFPNKVCCSKTCRYKQMSNENRGSNNPMYKHGRYSDPYCACGNKKDPRSVRCSRCARKSKGVGVDVVVPDNVIKGTVPYCKTLTELSSVLGTSRYWISNRVQELDIDLSHFQKCTHRPYTEDEILCNNSTVGYGTLRKHVLSNDLIEYICCECGNTGTWNDKDIILELHHINGYNKDNRIDNLVFLCPNCHTQTNNYRGNKNVEEKFVRR